MKNKGKKSGRNTKFQPKNKAGKPDFAPAGQPFQRRDAKSAPKQNFSGKLILYGFHAVREAWLNPSRNIQQLLATDQGAASFEDTLKESRANALTRPALKILDKKELEHIAPAGAVHQGLVLISEDLPEISIQDIIIAQKDAAHSLILVLDQVTDPHNIGAILRSACAFGAAGMVLQRKHAPLLDGALAKTACGALEHVPVAYETNLSRTIGVLKEHEYFVYGLDERGTLSIDQLNAGGKTALVLGAEGPGLRHLIKEHCDALVRLPMAGAMPSINVSNAAAISLYALSLVKS